MSDCFTTTAPRITLNLDTGLVSGCDPLADLFEYIYQRPLRLIIPPNGFELTGEISIEGVTFSCVLGTDFNIHSSYSAGSGLRLVCREKKMFAGYKFVLFGERQLIRPGDWYENQDGGMSKSSSIFKVPGSAKVFRRETMYEPQED